MSYLQKDLGVSLNAVVPSHCILDLLVIANVSYVRSIVRDNRATTTLYGSIVLIIQSDYCEVLKRLVLVDFNTTISARVDYDRVPLYISLII